MVFTVPEILKISCSIFSPLRVENTITSLSFILLFLSILICNLGYKDVKIVSSSIGLIERKRKIDPLNT